jgi:tetratricopeptide (TPR) repeat protein
LNDVLLGGHVSILKDLLYRIDAIRAGEYHGPGVIVLAGASGVGKSRILRELYAALSNTESQTGYWPPLQDVTRDKNHRGGVDPLPARKMLGPDTESFIWPAEKLPPFGWWTLDCVRHSGGSYVEVINSLRPQLDAHALPLAIARRRATSLGEKMTEWWKILVADVREASVSEAVSAVEDYLGQALNLAFPGFASVIVMGWKGVNRAIDLGVEQRQLSLEIHSGDEIGEARRDAAKEVAKALRALSHPDLPGIVLVEDLHLMDKSFAQFLNAAARADPENPLLVIGTAWPEGFHTGGFGDWMRGAESEGVVELVHVPDLAESELAKILYAAAPATSEQNARAIVNKLNNPLFLNLWLSLEDTKYLIDNGHGSLDASGLDQLPKDINAVLQNRWQELPAATKHGLTLAIAAQPSNLEGLPQFLPEIIACIASLDGSQPHMFGSPAYNFESVSDGLDFAVSPGAWCLLQNEVATIREDALYRVIWDEVNVPNSERLQQYRQNAQSLAVDLLSGWILEATLDDDCILRRSEPQVAAAANWLLGLHPTGTSTAHGKSHLVLAQGLGAAYQYEDAVDHIGQGLHILAAEVGPDHPSLFTARLQLSKLLGDSGAGTRAIDELRNLLVDAAAVFGPDHLLALIARGQIAGLLAAAGKSSDAAVQFGLLLEDQTRVLGPDHVMTLGTRSYTAECLAQTGQIGAAISSFQELLTDQVRVFGPDDRETLNTRGSLIEYGRKLAAPLDAAESLRSLLEDRTRVLGADDPVTLGTRRDLAAVLAESGELETAIAMCEMLIADQTRVLGADHPDTLIARGDQALYTGVSGNLDDAIIRTRVLLNDKQRILGPDHVDVLTSVSNLAGLLKAAGRNAEALTEYRGLQDAQERSLGQDHPDTLRTVGSLIEFMADQGSLQGALSEAISLFAVQERVLSPNHPDLRRSKEQIRQLQERMNARRGG